MSWRKAILWQNIQITQIPKQNLFTYQWVSDIYVGNQLIKMMKRKYKLVRYPKLWKVGNSFYLISQKE